MISSAVFVNAGQEVHAPELKGCNIDSVRVVWDDAAAYTEQSCSKYESM